MSLTLNSQKIEHYAKLAEVRRELSKGPKTWTQLTENLVMSRATLSKCLKELMKNGEIEKYSEVKTEKKKQKIEDSYRLLTRKEETVVVKVPGMFEEIDSFYRHGRTVKEDLDVEQQFVKWVHDDFYNLMEVSYRILDVRFAKLSPQERVRLTDEWIALAMKTTSENMRATLEWLIQKGKKSWKRIFAEYGENPFPFFKALVKFEEIRREDKRREIERRLKEIQRKGMRVFNMKEGKALSGKELALAQKREIKRLEKELEELS